MLLLMVVVALVATFLVLWFTAPSGWMTHVKTSMLGLLAAAPAIIDQLSNQVRWEDMLGRQQAAVVAGILVLMGILARLRGHIRQS